MRLLVPLARGLSDLPDSSSPKNPKFRHAGKGSLPWGQADRTSGPVVSSASRTQCKGVPRRQGEEHN